MSNNRSCVNVEEMADEIARTVRLAISAFGQLGLSDVEADRLCDAELSGLLGDRPQVFRQDRGES